MKIDTDTLSALADGDFTAAMQAMFTEQARRDTIRSAQQQAADAGRAYAAATADPTGTPTAWADAPAILPPGVRVAFTNGKTYRNVSNAWLPKTAGPGTHPLGWAAEGAPVTAWKADTAYKTGTQVAYQGKTYQCAQAHTSQVGWEPGAVPALWTAI